MSAISPKEIYENYKQKNLDKSEASDLLISVIENPIEKNIHSRISSVKFLGLIGSKDQNIYFFLENLLISDFNELVRGNAASIIIKNFPEQAIKPIKWALKHEKSESCIILIIKALEKSGNPELKSLLKSIEYINFEGKLFFPFGVYQIINLSSKNIDNILKIKGLKNLTNLRKLNLNFNRITEIEGLDKLNNLNSLQLQWNKIREIKGIENLRNLEYLYLNNNEIHEIKGIKNLSNLKSLMIYDNHLTEIQNLDHLSKLEILNLRNNEIKEIKGLDGLKNLKRLDLSNNRIVEIKRLDNLTNLEFLDLSHNQVSEINGLDHLKKLKFLDLRNNKITAIKQLKILNQLQHLYLGFNRISITENTENLNNLEFFNVENDNMSNTPFDFFYSYKSHKNSVDKNHTELIDIKFMPEFFKSQNVLEDLKLIKNPINFFTRSSWVIIWKNNEFEIFQLSKSGKILWVERRRKQVFS